MSDRLQGLSGKDVWHEEHERLPLLLCAVYRGATGQYWLDGRGQQIRKGTLRPVCQGV